MRKLAIIFASTLAVSTLAGSAAYAGGSSQGPRGPVQNAGTSGNFANFGKIHINQNGNGCRNRCWGEQTFNAGWSNGNTNVNVWGRTVSATHSAVQNAGTSGNFTNYDKIHINQNGNGCRNRCYGEQTFNAGFYNGNTNVNIQGVKGHKWP